jgi:hypothetical protein
LIKAKELSKEARVACWYDAAQKLKYFDCLVQNARSLALCGGTGKRIDGLNKASILALGRRNLLESCSNVSSSWLCKVHISWLCMAYNLMSIPSPLLFGSFVLFLPVFLKQTQTHHRLCKAV